MPATIDIAGQKHNYLTVLQKTGRQTASKQYYWLCKCDCGNLTEVNVGNITSGRTKSCGCLNLRKGKDSPNFKHGLSKTKGYWNETFLRKTYGLTPAQFEAMLEAQNGKCAICGKEAPNHHKKRLNVDHCHTVGTIRGLLCDACNRGLGLFKDDLDLLRKAIAYLEPFQNALAR